MSFSVHEVDVDPVVFEQLVRVMWTAYYQPYKPYFSAYNPVFGPTAADREAAIRDSIDRRYKAHLSDPESHWVYALDQDGTLVGGCQWKFHVKNPYANPDKPAPYDVGMWPEGSVGREFATEMLRKQYAHRRRWLTRKHAVAHDMFVHPKYRGRGVGSMLAKWGVQEAERRALDIFLHSTDDGRWIYEKHGLRSFQKIVIDMTRPDPSDEWEKLRHELGGLQFFLMWKPLNGVYEEGVTALPWEVNS